MTENEVTETQPEAVPVEAPAAEPAVVEAPPVESAPFEAAPPEVPPPVEPVVQEAATVPTGAATAHGVLSEIEDGLRALDAFPENILTWLREKIAEAKSHL